MNQFELDALMNKYPETNSLLIAELKLDRTRCGKIQVKRITKELLDETPQINEHTGSLVGIRKEERAFLMYKGGQFNEVKPTHSFESNSAHEESSYDPGVSIGEALIYEDIDQITMIVWVSKGLRIEGHYSTPDWDAEVYLLPEEFTLEEWRKNRQDLAATQLQDQIDAALHPSTDSDAL